MNSLFRILKIEFIQSYTYYLTTVFVSFILGISITIINNTSEKIISLTSHEHWNADLVALPKSVKLSDLKQELLNGQTTEFLPEALFDTTVSLFKDNIELSAVLAYTKDNKIQTMVKSNTSNIYQGLSWLTRDVVISPWTEQVIYSNPEWSNHVITAFFASGKKEHIAKLKDLINKKTVAQAIITENEEQKEKQTQNELNHLLILTSTLFFALILFSIYLLYRILNDRLVNLFLIVEEIGFTKKFKIKMLTILFLFSTVLPILIGLFVGRILT